MQISMAAQRKQIIKLIEVFMEVNEGIGFCHIDKGGGGGVYHRQRMLHETVCDLL